MGELANNGRLFSGNTTVHMLSISFSQRRPGYLLARTDSSGSHRWFALYSGTSSLIFYFRRDSVQESMRFSHNADFDAGGSHLLQLTVTRDPAELSITLDGSVLGMIPNAHLDTCGSGGDACATWLGQRQPGQFAFAGTIHNAVAHTIF